ncbi:MAG: winged helix-turn-helix domain-containing protein [Chloroflexi bacterium]|nr:winged helix-turn-helix domain-containing protein [Chloroflexota bacterium]
MTQLLSNKEARLIALAAQGFDTPRPATVGEAEIEATVRKLALVQLDSVNVVVRSHYMPFFARLGAYDRSLVERVAFDQRKMFEYWAHVASLVPIETYPLLRWRMEASQPRWRIKGLLEKAPGYVDAILEEVGKRGPMIASDLDDPGSRKGPWWGYSEGKIALEWHFQTGAVTTHSRRNFTRYYDLTERIIPADVLGQNGLTPDEAQKRLFLLGAKAHGVGTANDIADYFRLHTPTMRPRIRELVEDGRLIQVAVEGWDQPGYLHPDAAVPDEIHATALLTPFDSLVWRRERTERLFGFHYRIEIYVPEPKRQYGYYVMPFMLDGELVARVDLKADRQKRVLRVQSAFIEPDRPRGKVAVALASELKLMANWLELDRVVVGRKGDLISELRTEIKSGKK